MAVTFTWILEITYLKFFHWRATCPNLYTKSQELKRCQSKEPNGCAFETLVCQGVVQIEASVSISLRTMDMHFSHHMLDFMTLRTVNQMSLSVYN
jgi:hypothetical protein